MSIIDKTKALRDEAWQDVVASAAYRAFKGLDAAVKAMTGEESVLLGVNGPAGPRFNNLSNKNKPAATRITQGDVAARVLKANGQPLPIGRWLEKSVAGGINIKGDDPLPNFRSTVSRDKRFHSIKRNNMYFWWFTDIDLPESWKEATDPSLPGFSAASDSDSQEGGDGHAANNTNLAS